MNPDRVGAVVNPHAGTGDAAALYATLAGCFPDAEVDARITTEAADVPVAAREQGEWGDLLVVVGGDGTLREVSAALVDSEHETPLFVVPAGRGNSTYRHLYGSEDWRTVARALADGIETRPLEVGRVASSPRIAETCFVLGCTVGLFRSALAGAERLRWLPGPLAYLLSTVGAAVAADPVTVSVAVDGDDLFDGPARLVAVGGGRYRGSEFALLPESRPGDGLLHALTVEPTGGRGSVGLLRRARAGRLLEHPAVSYRSGERVTIEAESTVPVELDGTPVERPLESVALSVVPGAVSVAHPSDGT